MKTDVNDLKMRQQIKILEKYGFKMNGGKDSNSVVNAFMKGEEVDLKYANIVDLKIDSKGLKRLFNLFQPNQCSNSSDLELVKKMGVLNRTGLAFSLGAARIPSALAVYMLEQNKILDSSTTNNAASLMPKDGAQVKTKTVPSGATAQSLIKSEREVQQLIDVLSRLHKPSAVLVGESGLCKKAVLENFSELLKSRNVPDVLKNKRLTSVSGKGIDDSKIEDLVTLNASNNKEILFVDKLKAVLELDTCSPRRSASKMLKSELERGNISCIGTMTPAEYKEALKAWPEFAEAFQVINVDELKADDTLKVLNGIKNLYEKHNNVKIEGDVLNSCVNLSKRYIQDKTFPEKAIDLLDEASAHAASKGAKMLNVAHVSEVLANWTNLPVDKINDDDKKKLLNLENLITKKIVGQDDAVKTVSEAVIRGRAGVNDPKRPVGSFFFLGPTGVGKTALAKELAKVLFGDENSMFSIDMSEYMEKHTVNRLLGAPPGYIGHDEGGQLTEKIKKKPYSVVLFDEIEKAHPDVWNILLQILDEGRLTDGHGQNVDFKNTIVIMTSNIGSGDVMKSGVLGFTTKPQGESMMTHDEMKTSMLEELKKTVKPEFLNRIDDTVVFKPLGKEEMKGIVDVKMGELAERLKEDKNLDLKVTDSAKEYILNVGYDPQYGARPLKRAMQAQVETPIAKMYVAGMFEGNHKTVLVDVEGDKLVVKAGNR